MNFGDVLRVLPEEFDKIFQHADKLKGASSK